jgi:hypothetical protein
MKVFVSSRDNDRNELGAFLRARRSDAEPDQQLIVYTAEPGSRSEQALRELAAWAAEHISTAR